MSTARPIRVLVVDDSPMVRRTLEKIFESDPGVAVVGTAADGVEALAQIRALRPDVVTLDVLMPRLDGLKVLACVMRENPVRVLMLSSLTRDGASVTLQALDLGAVDFVDKTALLASEDLSRFRTELLAKLRNTAAVNLVRLGRYTATPDVTAASGVATEAGGAELVVIGASTGGPPALHCIIPALPADLSAGLVVVQHIPGGFIRSLAARLDAASDLVVREAESGDLVRPGEVLIAPGGRHLTFISRGGEPLVVLGPEPTGTLHCPSADVTMQSAAEVWGNRAAGVLLTGMGSDGAWGLWAIRARGGRTLAQSEESCVVFGMPRAAIEMGAVDEVVPLGEMAARILVTVCPAARRDKPPV